MDEKPPHIVSDPSMDEKPPHIVSDPLRDEKPPHIVLKNAKTSDIIILQIITIHSTRQSVLVLVNPMMICPFGVEVDASSVGMAAVLSQKKDGKRTQRADGRTMQSFTPVAQVDFGDSPGSFPFVEGKMGCGFKKTPQEEFSYANLDKKRTFTAFDLPVNLLGVAVKESTDPGNIFEFETTGGGKGLDMWLEREGRVEDHPEAPGVWDWGYCRKRAEKKAEMADRQCGILVSKEERSGPE
ncbi:unnamed protein product, partial [Ranitomeya imitator]